MYRFDIPFKAYDKVTVRTAYPRTTTYPWGTVPDITALRVVSTRWPHRYAHLARTYARTWARLQMEA